MTGPVSLWSTVGVLAFAMTACGGEAELTPRDFDHGTTYSPPSSHAQPPTPAPDYPPGPFGRATGSVLEDDGFLGWRQPKAVAFDPAKLELIRFSDYYDPAAAGSTRILWLFNVSMWCPVCESMCKTLQDEAMGAKLEARGVATLGLLSENAASPPAPATADDLALFAEKLQATHALALDPAFDLGPYHEYDAVPENVFVDTRTMKIVATHMGADVDTSLAIIDQVLSQ